MVSEYQIDDVLLITDIGPAYVFYLYVNKKLKLLL